MAMHSGHQKAGELEHQKEVDLEQQRSVMKGCQKVVETEAGFSFSRLPGVRNGLLE